MDYLGKGRADFPPDLLFVQGMEAYEIDVVDELPVDLALELLIEVVALMRDWLVVILSRRVLNH